MASFACRPSFTQHGATFELGGYFYATESDEAKERFAEAYSAFIAYLASLGFTQDTTYAPGTFRVGVSHSGQIENMYDGVVAGVEVRVLTRRLGDREVGLNTLVSYLSIGTPATVAQQSRSVELFRDELTAWLDAYSRDHGLFSWRDAVARR